MTQQATELWTIWTRDRDERAFEALVRSELPHALGFARRLGCSAADAEEAVQDALARLVAVHDNSPMSLGLRAWICREVHTRARSRLRSERRRKSREAAALARTSSATSDSPLSVREQVERVLAGLDAEDREAVQLRYLHDLDYREMAVVLGASEGACRQRVHKALTRLRARFGGDAAALVAALPLPAIGDTSVLVKGALTNAAVATAAPGGVAIMATAAQKVTVAAVAAAALSFAGAMAVQRAREPVTATVPSTTADIDSPELQELVRSAARAANAASMHEIEAMKARIASLEDELAAARERAADATVVRAALDAQERRTADVESLTAAQTARIEALQKSLSALSSRSPEVTAGSGDRAAEARRVLADLLAIKDMQKTKTLRARIDELVAIGDPAVPAVAAAFADASDREQFGGHVIPMAAGIVTYWPSQRTALYTILREIETPTADAAFLDAVRKADRLQDYQDLLAFFPCETDPVRKRAIADLIPAMLRKIREAGGVAASTKAVHQLASNVAAFISFHELKELAGPIEELLMSETPDDVFFSENLFRTLAKFDIRAAARVAARVGGLDREHRTATTMAGWLRIEPLARLVEFYETLLSQIDTPARLAVYRGMSGIYPSKEVTDDTKWHEEMMLFIGFLESRLGRESDSEIRQALQFRIDRMRLENEKLRKKP